ncbi:hypothetical protein ACSLNT_14700, partial [Escherichia coli]
MTPSNYQRTRWLTLIGTIITQFAPRVGDRQAGSQHASLR